MNWIGWLCAAGWVFGWFATLHETKNDGGWFKKWIIGPIVMFFVWPYVAWEIMQQIG